MANDAKITVAVERAVHESLCELARLVYEEHGIRINSAHFDWWDMSTASENKLILAAVTIESKTTV